MSTPDLTPLIAWLAPLLPYLLKGGIELAKNAAGELGKNISADAWERLKSLTAHIRKKAEAKPVLQDALTESENAPGDQDAQAALRLQLKKLAAEDPFLAAEMSRLWEQIRSVVNVSASGSRSVAIGGDVSGSVIITGDGNQVQK